MNYYISKVTPIVPSQKEPVYLFKAFVLLCKKAKNMTINLLKIMFPSISLA
jgi:hypothetical protein